MDDALLPCCGGASRRAFLKQAGLVVATGTLGLLGCDTTDANVPGPGGGNTGGQATGLSVSGNNLVIDLTKQTGLAVAGGFLVVGRVGGRSVNALVLNEDGTTFRAYTSICTHQACTVNSYNAGTKRFVCPCHGSEFNAASGSVAQGPASAPLARFNASREGDTLTVNLGSRGEV